jgi:acetyl esterase/lipase
MTANDWTRVELKDPDRIVYQAGSHVRGTFIRVVVPAGLGQGELPIASVLYLHGFALCMPEFYEAHVLELVRLGYVVFFPDYQRSRYPDSLPGEQIRARGLGLVEAQTLDVQGLLRQLKDLPEKEAVPEDSFEAAWGGGGATDPPFSATPRGLTGNDEAPQPRAVIAGDLRRSLRALLLVKLIIQILSWFRRSYGKHLLDLLSTVALSLSSSPWQWLEESIRLSEKAWDHLRQQESHGHWPATPPRMCAFGHSLGGLLALSLPAGFQKRQDQRLKPGVILVADPAASSVMGIPKLAVWLLRAFGSPFTRMPVTVQGTGPLLKVPVAILHGAADRLVPPATWGSAGKGPSINFQAIAAKHKALVFSLSSPAARPPLVAFHNQAVTCTQFFSEDLFDDFGGVKDGPNAYNHELIWPALHGLINGTLTPGNILNKVHPTSFAIAPEPPPTTKKMSLWIIAGLGAMAWLMVWLLRTQAGGVN